METGDQLLTSLSTLGKCLERPRRTLMGATPDVVVPRGRENPIPCGRRRKETAEAIERSSEVENRTVTEGDTSHKATKATRGIPA